MESGVALNRFDISDDFRIEQHTAGCAGDETGICHLDNQAGKPYGISWGFGRLRTDYNHIPGKVDTTRAELMTFLLDRYPDVFEFLLFHPELL